MALNSKPLDKVRPDVPVHLVAASEQVKMTFNVDKATRQRWKTEAAKRDTTVTDLIMQAMDGYLNK